MVGNRQVSDVDDSLLNRESAYILRAILWEVVVSSLTRFCFLGIRSFIVLMVVLI